MPSRNLWWFVEQMPVLQARESIMRVNELAYAFGSFSKEDGATYYHDLKVQATGPDKPLHQVAPRPKSLDEFAQMVGGKTKVQQIGPQSSHTPI